MNHHHHHRRLQVDYGVWGILRKVAVSIIVISIFVLVIASYVPALRQSQRLEEDIEVKRQALLQQRKLHDEYGGEILFLKTDPEAVERKVREKMGLAKPNEVIYHFESTKK
ncbi:MAG: septum formation initiator family protein [Verrucomicrobiae bacterium]|nr:septum formation initiator family protein [Verrucomicrobiae bacterium]